METDRESKHRDPVLEEELHAYGVLFAGGILSTGTGHADARVLVIVLEARAFSVPKGNPKSMPLYLPDLMTLGIHVRARFRYAKWQRKSTRYEDNFFSLAPGESRPVALDYDVTDLAGEKPQLIVEGWNVKMGRFSVNSDGETPSGKETARSKKKSMKLLSTGRDVAVSSTENGGNVAANALHGYRCTR